MAIILLGLVSSMAAIRVTCLETGETFDSMVIAARRFGVSSSLVVYHIQGKIRSVRGYHFTKEALLQPTVLRLRVDHAVQITAMCMESEPHSRHQLFLWMQKNLGRYFSPDKTGVQSGITIDDAGCYILRQNGVDMKPQEGQWVVRQSDGSVKLLTSDDLFADYEFVVKYE